MSGASLDYQSSGTHEGGYEEGYSCLQVVSSHVELKYEMRRARRAGFTPDFIFHGVARQKRHLCIARS